MQFRRWFTVLSVLVLFVGLASAQTNTQPALTCQIGQGAVTPLLRAEGYTELVGDIVLTCTGGAALAAGTAVPQANITVSMNAPVTSRLLPLNSGNPVVGVLSEALLLIDEPGAGAIGVAGPVAGYGPNAPQILCATPLVGCAQVVGTATGTNGLTYQVPLVAAGTAPSVQSAANVFQGIVANGNQVTFNGVPILPPGTNTVSRVIRITNIRINASYLGAPQANQVVAAIASVSANPSTVLPVGVAQPIVGFVNTSLQTSVTSAGFPFQQCVSQSVSRTSVVRFRELFASAFKTRVAALTNSTLAGQGTNVTGTVSTQNIPGFLYPSESGLIFPAVGNGAGTQIAGLTDFGTRVKAVFVNIPAGVSVFVGTSNGTAPSPIGGTSLTTYAQLVSSETASVGGSTIFGGVGGFPGVSPTVTAGSPASVSAAPLTVVNGTAVAVWEVLNSNPTGIDTLDFPVYISYTADTANNRPNGIGQVILSYAPTPSTGGFTSAAAAAASSVLPIPRFVDSPTATTFFSVNICQTVLLWPYVTTLTGFNTGIAIANTSIDPGASVITLASGGAQNGTCALYLYGTAEFGAVPTAPIVTPTINGGTVYANDIATLIGSANSIRSGYMFGVCNFQYAHGYGAISDNRAANWVTSYLALVVQPSYQFGLRGVAAESYVH